LQNEISYTIIQKVQENNIHHLKIIMITNYKLKD